MIYFDSLNLMKVEGKSDYGSFEVVEDCLVGSIRVRFSIVYRPPGLLTYNIFDEEFTDYVSQVVIAPGKLLVVGDFNYHVNKTTDKASSGFIDVIALFNLVQHVSSATHRSGNILNLVMTRSGDVLVDSQMCFPERYPVFIKLSLQNLSVPESQSHTEKSSL